MAAIFVKKVCDMGQDESKMNYVVHCLLAGFSYFRTKQILSYCISVVMVSDRYSTLIYETDMMVICGLLRVC